MLALEELILHWTDPIPWIKNLTRQTPENLPALRSVTILVECSDQRNIYKVIGTIMKLMPLLRKKGIVRIIRAE